MTSTPPARNTTGRGSSPVPQSRPSGVRSGATPFEGASRSSRTTGVPACETASVCYRDLRERAEEVLCHNSMNNNSQHDIVYDISCARRAPLRGSAPPRGGHIETTGVHAPTRTRRVEPFFQRGHSRVTRTRRHSQQRGRHDANAHAHSKTRLTRRAPRAVGRVPARDAPGSRAASTTSGVVASCEAHQSLLFGRPLKLRMSPRRLAHRFEAVRWLVQRPARLLRVRRRRTIPRAQCARQMCPSRRRRRDRLRFGPLHNAMHRTLQSGSP